MALSNFAVGTILAFVCSVAFGTQTSFAKIPSVIRCGVRMEILNIYFMLGVALCSLMAAGIMVLFFEEVVHFSVNGILCGIILYFGELFMLLGVESIGVAAAGIMVLFFEEVVHFSVNGI